MKNINIYLIIYIASIPLSLSGQQNTLLVYDFENASIDSITVNFDTSIQSESTTHFIGDYNSITEILSEETPFENIHPDSEFALKKKAALDFDLNNFPLRTSVKIFYVENDTLKDLCSGSMISQKHVLSAAHCFAELNSNNILIDSLIVCPVFNDGLSNPEFNCTNGNKLFFIKDWDISKEDIAIIELEDEVGQSTGWLSIGFDESDGQYAEDNFYKFSYPGAYLPFIDPIPYNGDTLYYSYGKINIVNQNTIGSQNTSGIPGESGSSIIRIKNNEIYTSHGVLSYGGNLIHSKITREIYFLFKSILQNELSPYSPDLINQENITVYPNPTKGKIQFKNLSPTISLDLKIIDLLGKEILSYKGFNSSHQIDLSGLANGHYYISFDFENDIIVKKVIKYGD